jgi:hypothetical protein
LRQNGLWTSQTDQNEKTISVAMPSTGKSMGQSNEFMKEAYTKLSNPMPHRKQIYSNKEIKKCKH